MRPAPPTETGGGASVDRSLLAVVSHWGLAVADLAQFYGLDMFDPAVLARPWPGVRTMLLSLLDMPGSRLNAALTDTDDE